MPRQSRSEPLPLSVRKRIDATCDRFEAVWKAGEQPRIEDYIQEAQGKEAQVLVEELLKVELYYRQKRGEQPASEEYAARFPELQQEIVVGLNAPGRRPRAAFPFDLSCPHCQNPITVVDDQPGEEVVCPSCGSPFRLDRSCSRCPRCDTEVEFGTAIGECPNCGSEVSTLDPCSTATFAGDRAANVEAPKGERTIAHFELLELLGKGHFGSVYRARDVRLDRLVALKLPRRDALDDAEMQTFFREARAAAQLRHPHIVAVHDVGRKDDSIYIVSELIDGSTLRDRLSGELPTPRQAAEWCATLADALHYAHEAGVIHRDLKPANVMLDRNDRPYVMDFGLAKRDHGEATMTLEGRILGTPAYMPPEQAIGKGHEADRRADVYSLGVILYEMLTGERPFSGKLEVLLHKVIHEEPVPPRKRNPRLARDLETICLKAVAKDPAARYQTAGDMAADLRRFCAGEAIQARPIGALRRLSRRVRRNPLPTAVIIFAVIAVGLVGYYFRTRSQEQARITGLTRQLNLLQDKADWSLPAVTDMLDVVDELRELSPTDADVALKRFGQNYAAFVSEASSVNQLSHIESVLERLDDRAPSIVRTVREAFRERQRNWSIVFDTGSPEFDPDAVFYVRDAAWFRGGEDTDDSDFTGTEDSTAGGPTKSVDDIGQNPAASDEPAVPKIRTVITRVPCEGSVEFTAMLAGGWDEADHVDLLFHAGAEHSGPIRHIEYSEDGRFLASASDREAIVWNVEQDLLAMVYDAPTGQKIGGVALFADGSQLAVALEGANKPQPVDRVVLLDTVSGAQAGPPIQGRFGAKCVAVSRDGKLLGYGDWGGIHIWDLQTRQLRHTFTVEDKRRGSSCAAFSRRGGLIVCGFHDGSVGVWNALTGERQWLLQGHELGVRDLAISRDSAFLATTDWRVGKVWDFATGRERQALPGATQVAFAGNDNLLTARAGLGIQTRDLQKNVTETLRYDSGQRTAFSQGFHAVAAAPRGDVLACESMNGRVVLMKRRNGELIRTISTNSILFRLTTETVDGRRETIAAAQDRDAPLLVQILQDDAPLYEATLPATLVDEERLTLRGRMIGTELSLQINDLPPHKYRLVFPRQRQQSGSYGLRVAPTARLDRLTARRQELPAVASLIELGDDLFARGNYDQALENFEEQASRATSRAPGLISDPVNQEARVKAGFCLLALNRPTEAEHRFAEVSVEPGDRWPLVAGCQLWLLYVKQGRYERPEGDTSDRQYASDVFEQLKIRYRFDQLASLVSQDVRQQIVGEYTSRVWGMRLLDPLKDVDVLVERADQIDDFFQASVKTRLFTKRSLVHAYQYAGRPEDALPVARELVQNRAYWDGSSTDTYMHGAVAEYFWLMRNLGHADEALRELDDLAFSGPDQFRPGGQNLLVERARVHYALGDRVSAQADLDRYFELANATGIANGEADYLAYSGACLMDGFLKQDAGDVDGAQKSWSRGVFATWLKQARQRNKQNARHLALWTGLANLNGNPMLHGLLLGSLTGELTDDDADAIWKRVADAGGQGAAVAELVRSQFSITPAMLRSVCSSPKAMDLARRIAFREVTLPEFRRSPVILVGAAVTRQAVFGGRVTPEQDALAWRLDELLYRDYLDRRISLPQFPLYFAAWKGNRGIFGWAGLEPQLSKEVRAPLAYILAIRHRSKEALARGFFQDALDSTIPSNEALIRKLVADARAELDTRKF